MKSILLVQTGGTISCTENNGELSATTTVTDIVSDRYQQEHPGQAQFTVIKPYTILSENLQPERWKQLTEAINKAMPERYDGVIVTHGTDSIDFTASFLKLHYGPGICTVGAFYPPTDPRSDAFVNFEQAVTLCAPIKSRPFDYKFRKGLVITAYPGLDYSLYAIEKALPDFVIHIMYHSGTGCTQGEYRCDLTEFIKKASGLNIPVYAIGFPGNSNIYAGRKRLEEAGMKFVPDLSFPEVLVKLSLGLKLPFVKSIC